MNAEKCDIEKMLEADAESIEIDLDFKAKLKADIMKINSSFENNNIIDFNAKTSEKTLNGLKEFKPYRKYFKIASSFAIVGLIGFNVGVGNFGLAKVDEPKAITVLERQIINVSSKNNDTLATNDELGKETKVEKTTDNIEVDTSKEETGDNKIDEKTSGENKVEENTTNVNNSEVVASGTDDTDNKSIDSNYSDNQIEDDDNEEIIKPNADENHDKDLNEKDEMQYASSNPSSENEENDMKAESILVSYGKENALDLYYGTLSMTEDEEYIIQNNEVYIQNEDAKEVIFTQEDNYELIGIKKVNDNEILLHKASVGNQENKLYQLSKLNIASKEEVLLVVEADRVVLNNTYDKLAFEINDNIVIKDIETEKQEKILNGKNIAWSPDGKYLSYVKTVYEREEGKQNKTYSLLVAYNGEANEETTLAENEMIVGNDSNLIGTYEYGENLWSKDNKCIYVVRENISIMSNDLGNKKQVFKLTFMN